MRLALVGTPGIDSEPAWSDGGVPDEFAIRGFHGVSLLLEKTERTAAILTDVFGYASVGEEDSVARYRSNCIGSRHDHRSAPGRRLPAGAAWCGLGASHCLPREGRCSAGRDGRKT